MPPSIIPNNASPNVTATATVPDPLNNAGVTTDAVRADVNAVGQHKLGSYAERKSLFQKGEKERRDAASKEASRRKDEFKQQRDDYRARDKARKAVSNEAYAKELAKHEVASEAARIVETLKRRKDEVDALEAEQKAKEAQEGHNAQVEALMHAYNPPFPSLTPEKVETVNRYMNQLRKGEPSVPHLESLLRDALLESNTDAATMQMMEDGHNRSRGQPYLHPQPPHRRPAAPASDPHRGVPASGPEADR